MRDTDGYIVMPKVILRELGSYAARLAGSLMDERRPSRPDEYRAVETIAAAALLPVSTARKLLKKLVAGGWLQKHAAGSLRALANDAGGQ